MLAYASPGIPAPLRARGCWRARSSSASSSPSPRRAPTWPAPAPGPPGTASSGSSTGRRSGAPSPTWPTRACAWPARTGTSPKHQGLTWFVVPCHAHGLTIRPIKQINEVAEFCEDFFDNVVVPDADRLCEVNEGWTVTQTMFVFERGAGRPEDGNPLEAPVRWRPTWCGWPGGPDASMTRSSGRSWPEPTRSTSWARRWAPASPRWAVLGRLDPGRRRLRQAVPGHVQPDAGPPGGRDRR